jgi:hypothetical protein
VRRLLLTAVVALGACGGAVPDGSPPSQPIAFSHRVHVTDNGIGCTMCHVYAEHAPVAGVPSLQRCNGCHKFVARDKPEVQKLNRALEERKPIEWVRVHRVPDHVYFTHERHIAAGLACQQCHGAVEKMDGARRVAPLDMGWCVDCHLDHKASTDCLTCHK